MAVRNNGPILLTWISSLVIKRGDGLPPGDFDTIPISTQFFTQSIYLQAIPPYGTCGFQTPFACSYGLACVAQNINSAQCMPLCSIASYRQGLLSPDLGNYYLSTVAAGCTLDGQTGTFNRLPVAPIDIGVVTERSGIAYPECTASLNAMELAQPALWAPAPAATAPPLPVANTSSAAVGSAARGVAAPVTVATAGNTTGGAAVSPPVTLPPPTPPPVVAPVPAPPSARLPAPAVAPPAVAPLPAAPVRSNASTAEQTARLELAAQAIGLNMAFFEIQRAGAKPQDAVATAPQVWEWKKEAFLDVCTTLRAELGGEAGKSLVDYPGYFEAGSALSATFMELDVHRIPMRGCPPKSISYCHQYDVQEGPLHHHAA